MLHSVRIKVQLNQHNQVKTKGQQIGSMGELLWQQIEPELITLYRKESNYPFLYSIILNTQKDKNVILYHPWGKKLSTLTDSQLESFITQTQLLSILNMIVQLEPFLIHISLGDLYFQVNQGLRVLVTKTCSIQNYFKNAKQVVSLIFAHIKPIVQKNKAVKNMRDFQRWLKELKPAKQPKKLAQLLQLKLQPIPKEICPKISLSAQEKSWVLQQTGNSQTQKMQLVYNGVSSSFSPAPLLKAAHKKNLLFLLQTTEGRKAAFWMAAKPQINTDSLFGQYYPDKTKKSVLLGLDKRSVHKLGDENYSVGLGSQILLAIGKTDLVLSALNISNVSYFPCSYSRDEDKGVAKSEDLLGKQFTLRQLQAYSLT